MPDPVNTETNAIPVVPPQPEPTPQDATRTAIYERLYGQTPEAQPVAAAATSQAEPDYKAMFTALVQEVQGLKGAFAASQTPAEPVVPQADWFELLQTGRRTEAEKTLTDKIASQAGQTILQQAVMQAQELYRTERTIEDFNNSIRAQNPDLLDVEDLVALKAEQYFRVDQAKIRTPSDHIGVYKNAVTQAVTDIRNRLQRTRAVARNEAMTTRREVLGASTMTPNIIQSVREQSQPQGNEVPDTSTQSYLEMRRQNAGQRNLPPDVRRALNANG